MTKTIECGRCGRELKTEKSIEQGYGGGTVISNIHDNPELLTKEGDTYA